MAQTDVRILDMVEQQVNNVEEVKMIDMKSLKHVRVKQSEVKMQLQRAQSGLVLSRMALCQIIGVPYSTYIIATDSAIQTDIILVPAENYNIEDRPEYKLLEKSVQLKQGEIQLARGNYLPTVGLGAAYAYMGNVSIGGQTDPPYNISNIMATVNVPITHWWEGSQKIKSAKREKNIAQLELEKNSELMQLQIQQTIFNLHDSYQQIKIAEEALKANE